MLRMYHLTMKSKSRGAGQSAVAAAAYRSAECILDERTGLTHDFTRRRGVEHVEIALPSGVQADWAKDRAKLWNAAERAEVRKDARVAREFEIGVPHQFTAEQRLEATRLFAQALADRYGAAVDFAIHSPQGKSDIRNHHAHLLMTTRVVEAQGLGAKTQIERENKWLLSQNLPTSQMQLRDIRVLWEQVANERLAAAGLDLRIDHRSHRERGLEIEPTRHVGVHATQLQRQGVDVSRVRLDAAAARRNAELIREKPEQVLTLITGEKSVFDRHDIARALHRYVDDPEAFQAAFAKVMASPVLVELRAEVREGRGVRELARYSTREMVTIERELAGRAMRMSEGREHGVDRRRVQAALTRHDGAIRRAVEADTQVLLERGQVTEAEREKRLGVARLSDEQRQSVEHITGPEQIAVVVGFAGAGKSTMLAAAREAWEAQGFTVRGAALAGKAVEGLEESSGIASRTLSSYEHSWRNGRGQIGPRDVLVIDEAGMVSSRQLGRFVAEAERKGAKLVLVGDHEQLQAIGAGAPFRAIAECIGFAELQDIRRQREEWQREASQAFARHQTAEGLAGYAERGAIRFSETCEEARGEIARNYLADLAKRPEGSRVALAHRRVDVRMLNEAIREARQELGELARGEEAGERIYHTNDGKRAFAAGDRILFLENNRDLGVKNGMLGTVTAVSKGHIMAELDHAGRDGMRREVTVSIGEYAAIDHGYATTIHKTQGSTVDRAFVLASATMNRHLTYVAMTRHRGGVELHAGRDEFKDLKTLTATLSRNGQKESTLDYTRGFAERRGIAEQLGIRSEIEVSRYQGHNFGESQVQSQRTIGARSGEERSQRAEPPRRGIVDGLELEDALAHQQPEREETLHVEVGRQVGTLRPTGFERAVGRYARAFEMADRNAREGLPVLKAQTQALRQAGVELDQVRPGASVLLASTLRHDPQTRQVVTELSGRERVGQLIAGMNHERAMLAEPNIRAERFVQGWQKLQGQRRALQGWRHEEARQKVEAQMRGTALLLERDPQVESILRSRSRDLGISHVCQEQSLARAMEQQLTQSRSQGLTFGL